MVHLLGTEDSLKQNFIPVSESAVEELLEQQQRSLGFTARNKVP